MGIAFRPHDLAVTFDRINAPLTGQALDDAEAATASGVPRDLGLRGNPRVLVRHGDPDPTIGFGYFHRERTPPVEDGVGAELSHDHHRVVGIESPLSHRLTGELPGGVNLTQAAGERSVHLKSLVVVWGHESTCRQMGRKPCPAPTHVGRFEPAIAGPRRVHVRWESLVGRHRELRTV